MSDPSDDSETGTAPREAGPATAATTRERIAAALREDPATASGLSDHLGVPRAAVYDHLQHVARSLRSADEQFLVAPPECRECGFDRFDDPLGDPSRCPDCRAEAIEEAAFTVE
jgi:hypothetical protein